VPPADDEKQPGAALPPRARLRRLLARLRRQPLDRREAAGRRDHRDADEAVAPEERAVAGRIGDARARGQRTAERRRVDLAAVGESLRRANPQAPVGLEVHDARIPHALEERVELALRHMPRREDVPGQPRRRGARRFAQFAARFTRANHSHDVGAERGRQLRHRVRETAAAVQLGHNLLDGAAQGLGDLLARHLQRLRERHTRIVEMRELPEEEDLRLT